MTMVYALLAAVVVVAVYVAVPRIRGQITAVVASLLASAALVILYLGLVALTNRNM